MSETTTFQEGELLPIAALQHLAFCERQWGLMYLENQWQENRLTAQGGLLHKKAHQGGRELREGIVLTRGLRLHSLRLGLVGVADLVEFHPAGDNPGVELPGLKGLWRPRPVEYKRGRPKVGDWDLVQLCAQALCLEEMLGVEVPQGDIFYGQPRRRLEVELDAGLRRRSEELCRRLHRLTRAGVTPPPRDGPHCRSCSLVELCLPKLSGRARVSAYLARARRELAGPEGGNSP